MAIIMHRRKERGVPFMAKCLVIADDLTGANATGVLLKKNGFDTYTLLSGTLAEGFEVPPCDCLVIPTDSRGISSRDDQEPPEFSEPEVFCQDLRDKQYRAF